VASRGWLRGAVFAVPGSRIGLAQRVVDAAVGRALPDALLDGELALQRGDPVGDGPYGENTNHTKRPVRSPKRRDRAPLRARYTTNG
jgi:hypothetical protein